MTNWRNAEQDLACCCTYGHALPSNTCVNPSIPSCRSINSPGKDKPPPPRFPQSWASPRGKVTGNFGKMGVKNVGGKRLSSSWGLPGCWRGPQGWAASVASGTGWKQHGSPQKSRAQALNGKRAARRKGIALVRAQIIQECHNRAGLFSWTREGPWGSGCTHPDPPTCIF